MVGRAHERIKLGTAIMQLSARAPAATAMAALSLDHLCGGRFIAGLGVSGPQVVEGWYGAPFAKPLARTREYVGILRQVFAREGPVTNDGPHYPLPLPSADGLGKPLKPSIHPLRRDLPIYLGRRGPEEHRARGRAVRRLARALFSPSRDGWYRDALGEARRDGARRTEDFEVAATVPMVVSARSRRRPTRCARCTRSTSAAWARGRRTSTPTSPMRLGYEDAVDAVQEHYLAGRKDDAAADVPLALIDELALIGPPDRVRDRLGAWRGVRRHDAADLRLAGDAADRRRARPLAEERAHVVDEQLRRLERSEVPAARHLGPALDRRSAASTQCARRANDLVAGTRRSAAGTSTRPRSIAPPGSLPRVS